MPQMLKNFSYSLPERNIFKNLSILDPALSVLIDSSVVDAGSTPTTLLRPGLGLVKRTSTGKWILASDSNGDTNTPATVTALETANASWASKQIDFYLDGGLARSTPSFSVTMGAVDDTDAEIVVALNANAIFAANLIADVQASRVRIRTREAGAHKSLRVFMNVYTGSFGALGTEANGTDAEYYVLGEYVSMLDGSGVASDMLGKSHWRARYLNSQLIGATADMKSALVRRGCSFES